MKIYLRHIFNSIKQKPMQPLLIIITMMMCVVLFVIAFIGKDIFFNFNTVVNQSKVGDADISINVDGAKSSFIQIGDVENALGDAHNIFGYFWQTMAAEIYDNTYSANTIATDMTNTKHLSEFNFVKKGEINTQNINDLVVINVIFAEKHKLDIGDSIFLIFGESKKEYKVGAIALDTGIFFTNEIMVNIDTITSLIALETGLHFFGKEFLPYNKILVKLNGDTTISDAINLLKADENFADTIILNAKDNAKAYQYTEVQDLFIVILCTIICIIAISFIYSTFSIAMAKRLYFSALFRSMGATKTQMHQLMLVESLVYSLIGAGLGVPLSLVALNLMEKTLNINALSYNLTLEAAFFAIILGLCICALSVILASIKTFKMPLDTMLKGETKYYRLPSFVPCIVFAVIFIIGFIILQFVSVKYYYIIATILALLFAVLIVFLFPFIFKGITYLIEFLESKRDKKGYFTFIIKNTKRNLNIQSITRVFMLVVAFYLVIAYALHFASVTKDAMVDTIKGEIYAKYAFGIEENSLERIRNLGEVNSVTLSYVKRDNFFLDGRRVPIVAVDGDVNSVIDFSILGDKKIENIKDNEIIMPESLAFSMGKKVGDEVVLNIQEENTYILKDTFSSNYNFAIVTKSGARVFCDLLIIDIKDDCDVEDTIAKIKQEVNSDSIVIGKKEEINATPINNVDSFIRLGNVVAIIIGILAGAGILDSVINNYRQREQEFKLLRQAGMSKKGLISLLSLEVGVNLIISISISIILAYVMLEFVSLSLLSYGLDFKLW